MALIEHLEHGNWEKFLRDIFPFTLGVMKDDRHMHLGSSADDLRAWLARGGVARVLERLEDQMDMRRFPPARREAVIDCVKQLAQEHRRLLLDLISRGEIPAAEQEEWTEATGITGLDVQNILDRILAGERPFEDWMRAHGHSDEEIAEIYGTIDRWLIKKGIIEKAPPWPPPSPILN